MVIATAAATAPAISLPDQADDVTSTEAHWRLMAVIRTALSYVLGDAALVLSDIFVRVEGREQVSPDVLVAPPDPAHGPADHRVYALPEHPAPRVTIEVLSAANYDQPGRGLLEAKRSLFARIGVPLHIEIDQEQGVVTTWSPRGGEGSPRGGEGPGEGPAMVRRTVSDRFDGPELGGARIVAVAPGDVRVYLPNGHQVLDSGQELARAEAEAARADRLAARLRELGADQ
ncbi:MAG: Uma2 family endonuclease [Acidimicrobiales bacterium]